MLFYLYERGIFDLKRNSHSCSQVIKNLEEQLHVLSNFHVCPAGTKEVPTKPACFDK